MAQARKRENPHLYFRPETAFFYEVKANIDSFSSFRPVLPYPPQEMLDFQLFNQVMTNSKRGNCRKSRDTRFKELHVL